MGVEVWGGLPRCRLGLEKSIKACGPRHRVCRWVRPSGQGARGNSNPGASSGLASLARKALGVRLCRLEARPPEDVQGPYF